MAYERKERIPVYVSPDELRTIRLAAALTGESLSEYLRRAALTMAKAPADEQQRTNKEGKVTR